MRRMLATGAAVGVVAAVGIAGPAQAHPRTDTAPTATIGLFHGIPKTPVDVYVGSKKVVDDFQPGTFAGPVLLRTGTYTVRITAADATSPKQTVISPKRFHFIAGKSYSVIAHLTAKGKPTATKYRNDTTALQPGKGRVTVRHVAAAPPVAVILDGRTAVAKVKNPKEAKAVLKVGTYETAVALAGTKKPVLGPVDLPVQKDVNTIVYAWGSAKDGTLALTTRTVPLKPYQP